MSKELEQLEWLKGIYSHLIKRTTDSKQLTPEEEKAFDQLEKGLERLEKLDHYLPKWEEQLKKSCVNSKGMVLNDIQFLMRERK
jgi:hypothetical protein